MEVTAPDAYGAGAESDTSSTHVSPTTANAQSPKPSAFGSLGPLLEEQDKKKVVDTIVALIREQQAARRRRRAEWRCNELWLEGVRGVRLRQQSEDRNDVELLIPLGAYDVPPVMDRVGELCEKTIAHLLSDPPVPDAEPATDSDTDRDAAEFTTRLLTVEGSESGFNNLKLMFDAGLTSTIYSSAFIYACLDPTGNGWRPTEIQAHPQATTEQDAAVDPQTKEQLGAGDPMLKTRYVAPDGTLVDDQSQARPQWLPKIVPEILTGESVVLLPESCSGINDAKGCCVIRYTPLAQLKGEFKELADIDDETARKLVGWSFDDAKYARPGFQKATDIKATTDDGKVSDSAMVCTVSLYFRSYLAYPKGAYIVVGGDDLVLHRQPWSGMVESVSADGASTLTEECLMLPLAQARFLDDTRTRDHMGKALVPKIGPADDVRGTIVLSALEHLDNSTHPIPMLPLGSIVPPGALQARDGTPIYFNPQGKPEWEVIPPFPPDAINFFDRATEAQNSAVGLEETAQGTDSPNSQSGIAKQIVVQQSHVNLSRPRANLADCQERWWRICAQIMRVFYTIPTLLKYQGEDGAYKEREWTRVDLGSTKDIKIARGSYTQQAPETKQQNLDTRYLNKLLDQEEHERLSNENIGSTYGFQDNPHRMRIRRQLSAFKDGPPADFDQKNEAFAMATQQYQQASQLAAQQAAMTGQPAPQQPPPIDTSTPFDSVPVDREQDVAHIRWMEMRRTMASTSYSKQPPPWRQKFDVAYDMARKDAGIQTVAEQQAAAQQQAQAQQQQAAQQSNDKAASQGSKQQHEANQSAEERAFAADQGEAKHRMELERQALTAQGDGLPRQKAPPLHLIPT